MKKILLCLSVFCILLSSCVINKDDDKRTVRVTGVGEVEISNDRAVISFSVVSRNNDINKAAEENSETMNKIQKALEEEGISKNYLATLNYNIYQEQNYTNGKNVMGQYVVSNQVEVTVADTEKCGKIIDAAIKAGANQLNGISFSCGNTEEQVKQARILAVRDAEQKANTLVTSSGACLGKLVSISEGANRVPHTQERMVFAAKAANLDSTPVFGDKSIVRVTVDMVYEISNK